MPGIDITDSDGFVVVLIVSAVLGLVNALVRPILVLLSCGLVVLTMGLFLIVINGFTLWLSAWIAEHWLDVGFTVDGLIPALLGGIVVSIISFVLNIAVTASEEQSE